MTKGKRKQTLYQRIISELAAQEGKRSQVAVGDIREIVGLIADMSWEMGANVFFELSRIGARRAKRRKRG